MQKVFLTTLFLACCLFSYAVNPIEIKSSENRHGPEKGSLVIIGGGIVTDEIWERFIDLAGGAENARIVVVTNASAGAVELYQQVLVAIHSRLPSDRIKLLNLSSVQQANDPEKVKAIRESTGVYFTGGRQWRIADVYLNTLAHAEFRNLLDRGGVIAGSSAGASIQGSLLWRGDTSGYDVRIGDHTQGLGFLRNSVIDQHLLVRNRQFDLVGLLSYAPNYIGLGLDESTAVVVTGDELEVIGESVVAVYGRSEQPFFFLNPGQRYSMSDYEVIKTQK